MFAAQNLIFALITTAAAPAFAQAPAQAAKHLESRVTYSFTIDSIPEGAAAAQAWAPVPESNEFQEISNVTIEPKGGATSRDALYQNQMLHIEWKKPIQVPIKVTISFDVRRVEETAHKEKDVSPALAKRFLEGDKLAPINDRVKEMAAKAVDGKKDTMSKARAIYDFVLDYMTYNKDGTGWGRGDVNFACDSKRGNCSDFHALFIAMARSQGIPARFHYGFSLKSDGTTAAHCWAEFLDSAKGWVPVDISEADKVIDKDPSKRDYYFGTLSENRVLLTTGRDIVLEPKQSGEPLNFLYAPYVEVDGKSVTAKLDVTHQVKK